MTFHSVFHKVLNSENNQLIDQLRQDGKDALATIYKLYRAEFIQWMRASSSCDEEEAKDLYQQSIIILYENVVGGRLTEFTSSIKTYLFGIGKNKLREMDREKSKQRKIKAEDLQQNDDASKENRLQQVETCVERLGEPCRSLLIQYYYHKRSIDQLKELFNYRNIETAKNQKYKCLERLRKLVKEDDPKASVI